MAEMTDNQFIGYCEIHCTTERVLFYEEQILRILVLSGRLPQAVADSAPRHGIWQSVGKREMLPACAEARKRLAFKEAGDEVFP